MKSSHPASPNLNKIRRLKKSKALPVMPAMCGTCPFRVGSPYTYLSGDLGISALTDRSRICHSTGANNAINKRTGQKPKLCRGARNLQLQWFAAIGFIDEPTDAAWDKKRKQLGL